MNHSSTIPAGSGQPLGRSDGARSQRQRRRASERTKATIYALVDAREGYCCRLTGKAWNLEHHHVVPRARGGVHHSSNVVLIHRSVHRDIHEGRLTVTGDADDVLVFRYRDGRVYRRENPLNSRGHTA